MYCYCIIIFIIIVVWAYFSCCVIVSLQPENVMKTCITLFGKDYKYTVSNQSHCLCIICFKMIWFFNDALNFVFSIYHKVFHGFFQWKKNTQSSENNWGHSEPVNLVIRRGKLWWFEHVERKDISDWVKWCMSMETRHTGCPKKTWWDCGKEEFWSFL